MPPRPRGPQRWSRGELRCRPEVTGVTRAMIIGGGVAGPVAAMALQKVGIDASVHEAYTAPAHDVGAWLGLQTNGLDALRAIEAEQSVLDVGFPTPRIEFRSWTGKVLGSVSTGSPQDGGTVGLSMKRSELYRALHSEAVRRGVDIRYGSRLVDARTSDHGVTAVFADGTTDSADLLVGGDGVRSTVRSLVDSSSVPRYVPVLNTAGYSEHTPADAEVGRLTMVFGKRAFFGYLVAPTGKTWWVANPPMPREPAAGRARGVVRPPADAPGTGGRRGRHHRGRGMAVTALRPLRRRPVPSGRPGRGHARCPARMDDVRHADRAQLALRAHGADRRRRTRDLAGCRPGGLPRRRGRRHPRPLSPRPRCPRGLRALRGHPSATCAADCRRGLEDQQRQVSQRLRSLRA